MLAKAHITIGMAAALTLTRPETAAEALPVIAGAAAGCLICDIDCDIAAEKKDSSRWRVAMAALFVCVLIEDHLLGAGMWEGIRPNLWFFGIAGFALACTFAGISKHRGFSHSLLAMAIETACLWMVFPSVCIPFMIAFLSHIVLDIMNKKPVRVLYPAKKGWCLGWFYANKTADKAFAALGTAWFIAIAVICIRR
ncbi:MAG: metal-dependent hydrolase [Mogibacterium sp.]|nr:metal-dependent hydrolase [Mogibacterium sp.]